MRFYELAPGILHYLSNEEETLLRKIAIETYPKDFVTEDEREETVAGDLVHRGILDRTESGFRPSKVY